jgi:hypothetical protein
MEAVEIHHNDDVSTSLESYTTLPPYVLWNHFRQPTGCLEQLKKTQAPSVVN